LQEEKHMKVAWKACVAILALSGCSSDGSSADGGNGGATAGGSTASTGGGGSGGATGGSSASGGSRADGGNGAGNGGDTGGGSGTVGSGAAAGDGPLGGAPGAGGTSARSACKRGVAYGYHSKADLEALSPGVSFWYNWAFVPDQGLADGSYRSLDVEYVPMIWGEKSNREAAASDIPGDARTLLGFNEPNFGSQANLSAADAAALWPELEEIADARGLDLVSPAVNFCGGDCQETDPFKYLDDFFAACQGCRVDAVAIHLYVGCNPDGEDHAEWLINHVKTYEDRFSQPLWLTEFACDSAANEEQQIAFMEDAVEFLEGNPRIARYAWFAGRADNVPHVDLLGSDGELTALGQRYVELDQPADCQR
jgi:hypothetical protein